MTSISGIPPAHVDQFLVNGVRTAPAPAVITVMHRVFHQGPQPALARADAL